MADLFISYSRLDLDRALILKGLLESRKHQPWIDLEQLPAASLWRGEVAAAIEHSDAFVFALSPDSVASPECRKELEHALALNKRLVPVVLRDVVVESTDERLRDINWIFFREPDDRERALDQLDDAIALDLDHLRAHTRILLAALDWQRAPHRSAVLRGRRLKEAELWCRTADGLGKKPAPTQVHRAFIAASRKARKQRVAWTAVLGAGAAVAAVVVGVRWWQRSLVTESQELASRSRQADDTSSALRLAVDARRTARTASSVRALVDALDRSPQLQRILETGSDEIESLAFGDHGGILAAAGRSGVVHSWDTQRWTRTRAPLPVSRDRVTQIAFLPDGRRLASGGWDGVARIWSFASGALERELDGRELGVVESFAIDPSGRWMVVGYTSGGRIWDLSAVPPTATDLPLAGKRVNAVAFTPDGDRLAVVEAARRIDVWRFADGALGAPSTRDVAGATALSFDASGERLVTGVTDTRLLSLATDDLEEHESSPAPTAKALALGFSDDGELVAIGGTDGRVRVRSADGDEVVDLPLAGRVFAVAFEPGTHRLAASGTDGRVWLWDADVVQRLARPIASWPGAIKDIRLGGSDGRSFVAGTLNGYVVLGHLDDPGNLHVLPVASRDSVNAVALVGDLVLWGDEAGQLGTWSRTDERGGLIVGSSAPVTAIAATDDGVTVAWGTEGGEVHLLERRAGSDDWSAPIALDVTLANGARTANVFRLRTTADGSLLAMGDADGNVIVWDLAQRRQHRQWSLGRTAIDLAFSPDGRWLAVASYDGAESTILSVLDDAPPHTILTGCDQSSSVAFRRDGEMLSFGCKEGTLQLFDVPSWQPVGRLAGSGDALDVLASSVVEDVVVAATDAGGIVAWDLDETSWMRRGCRIVSGGTTVDPSCEHLLKDAPPAPESLERRRKDEASPIPGDVASLGPWGWWR